jgi:hypothetical protein
MADFARAAEPVIGRVLDIAQAKIQLTSAIDDDEIDLLMRNFDLYTLDDDTRKSYISRASTSYSIEPISSPPIPRTTFYTPAHQRPGQVRAEHPRSRASFHLNADHSCASPTLPRPPVCDQLAQQTWLC